MLKLLLDFFKILNSETEPRQISLAVCFAMMMGVTPMISLHNLLVLFLVCVLRVHIATFLLSWPLIAGIAYLLDPLLHQIGWSILTASSLQGIWTAMYSQPVFRLAHFNNSLVMGGLAVGLIGFLPCFFLANFLVTRYREHFLAWVEKTRIVKILKASKLYQIYQTVGGGAA